MTRGVMTSSRDSFPFAFLYHVTNLAFNAAFKLGAVENLVQVFADEISVSGATRHDTNAFEQEPLNIKKCYKL